MGEGGPTGPFDGQTGETLRMGHFQVKSMGVNRGCSAYMGGLAGTSRPFLWSNRRNSMDKLFLAYFGGC